MRWPSLRGLLLLRAESFQHDHEFIAPQPRHGIAVAQTVIQAQCHFLQQAVAHVVAQGVVEGLEVVQIDKQQGAGLLVARAIVQRHLQPVQQQAAVGQLGERVVKGQPLDLVFRCLALGDVAHGADVMTDLAIVAQHRADAQPFRVDFAVLAAIPDFPLPGTQFAQAVPQAAVEGRVVPPGLQDADLASHHIFGLVAGDFAEGAVHPQDDSMAVGDHHAFLGFEGRGGNPQQLFGMLAFGNIARGSIQIAPAANIHGLGIDLYLDLAAILAAVACFEVIALSAFVLQQLREQAGRHGVIPVGQLPLLLAHFIRHITQHAGEGIAEFGEPAIFIQDVDAIRRRLQQRGLAHGFCQRRVFGRLTIRGFLCQCAGAQCHQQGQFGAVAAQLQHLPGQPAQQNADAQHQRTIDRDALLVAPAILWLHIQRPHPVRHIDVVMHWIVQLLALAVCAGNDLHLFGVRMPSPQTVLIAALW